MDGETVLRLSPEQKQTLLLALNVAKYTFAAEAESERKSGGSGSRGKAQYAQSRSDEFGEMFRVVFAASAEPAPGGS